MQREHTTRLQKGYWNRIWSDMYIETSFMKYGKVPCGLIGLTKYGLIVFILLLKDLDNIYEQHKKEYEIFHEEEMPARIKADADDRENIHQKLNQYINPLDTASHPRVNQYHIWKHKPRFVS